jgi:dienelactone hydrolase
MHRSGGDPARIAAVTSSIEHNYAVDTQRVYAAGLSSGGGMASVLGATYPDMFAAIGIGSGCEYAATAACAGYKSADPAQAAQQAYKEMGAHARPMPFIAFEGDGDTTVPPVNADQLVQQWLTTDDLADDGSLNGSVPGSPAKTSQGQVPGGRSYTLSTYNDGHGSELAQYWVVHGMNHAWSGGDGSQSYSDASGPDESAAMYAFFQSHVGTAASPITHAPPAAAAPAPASVSGVATAATPQRGASTVPKPRHGVPTVSKPRLSHGRVVFAISGPGSVALRLQRRVTGTKTTKYSTVAKVVRVAVRAGRMSITQPRSAHRRRLTRGRYHVVVTPADAAGRAGTSRTVALVVR